MNHFKTYLRATAVALCAMTFALSATANTDRPSEKPRATAKAASKKAAKKPTKKSAMKASKKAKKTQKAQKIPSAQIAPGYDQHPLGKAFIEEMTREHGFDAAQLNALFSEVRRNDRVIELMDAPVRRPAQWFEYVPRFMTEDRINEGVAFARNHAALLAHAEIQYGVPAHIIAAIIGVETFYGRITGNFSVIDALATLAFDYPRRADFFRGELKHFLLLNRARPNVALTAKGSYAGAMGLPQFMPGSYANYAVDFDNDSRIDLWGSPADIIGSVANYFVKHGWQPGQPVWTPLLGAEANSLPAIDGGLSLRQPISSFRGLGLPVPAGVPDASEASVLLLEENDGPRYFLAYHNWYVITRYNRSRLYASAVWTLAEAIQKRR